MAHRNTSSMSPRSQTTTTSRPPTPTKTVAIGRDINCIAVDQSATLGSFYDARTESVVGKLSLNKNIIIKKSQHKAIDCIIMNGDSFNIEEVFHQLRIDDEPKLDLMLNSASVEGIGELCKYSFSKSRNTRYLIYYYLSEEQSISTSKDVVKLNIPKVLPDSTVTHVISTVKLGIQAVIVLQLLSSDDANLDRLLDETKRQLLNSKFQMSNSERVPLDQIIVTKVFSNIPDLCKMSKLSHICQRITELKLNAYRHCQVEYTLRSIHWFYSSYPKEKGKYIPLDLEKVRIITQHLLSLSSQINKLKMSLNTDDKQRLRKPLKKQYDTIEEQFLQVEEMYQSEIKRIRDLVMKIRCGTMQQDLISQELLDISKQSLQNSIQHIETYLQSLKENEELSNRIDQDNITSMHIAEHSKNQAVGLNTSFENLHPNHRSGFKSGDQLEEPKRRLSATSSTAQSLEQGPSTSLKTSTSLTSSTIAKLGAEHAPERKTVNVNNKEKLVSSRKLSTSQESVESEDHAKGNDESVLVLMTQQTTTARDLTNQDIEAEDVEKTSNQPAPKPLPRKNKPMASKDTYILSGTETKSTTENARPKSSISSPPPVRPRTKPRDGNLKESATNLINSSTSDTIQSAVKGSESTKVRPKSSSASTSSKKVSQELNRPMSASTSLKPANTMNTSFQKTLRRSINEQNKSSMHSTESLSHICLTLNSPNEVNDDSLNLSKSLQETNFERTFTQSEQPIFEKDSTMQLESQNSTTPKVRSRERRASEKNELEILNETCKIQQSPKILTPQGVSISTQKEHLNHQSCLPSSTTEGPKYTDNSQTQKEQAEDKKKQTTPSSLLPSFNKFPGTRQKHVSPPISTNLIDTMETFTNQMQSVEVNEKAKPQLLRTQSFSDIRSETNTKNDDNKKLLNSSASSKSSKMHNKSLQPSRSVSSDNLSDAPRQPTRPDTAPLPARLRRQHSKNETKFTQKDSFKSSTTEIATFLKEQVEDETAQINHLNTTKISVHQDLPQTNQEVISHKELTNPQTLSKPKHVNKMSSSEGKVMCTVGPVLPLEFRSDVSSENVQPNNNASQVARIRTEQLDLETSSTEHAPILEQKSRDIITPNHIQLLDTQPTQESIQGKRPHFNSPRPSSPRQSLARPSSPRPPPAQSSSARPLSPRPPPAQSSSARASSPSIKYINILLLGASGVGKSTFINALVNYLAFQTFSDAQANQPLVVMPVSFLLTEGDDFREKIVRFGGIDPNEDHDHPGQSVTQHCRGYIISLNDQTKLRIIDTPGMGDTRGLEQDDRNMEHILSFISHLSHLDAICILLKPNESRLTIVLRSYFTRLLSFLGENARNNIVFCFTNTRSTFYAPGDTAPLLKQMLRDAAIKNIPFKKENTFCFDSESFRYLVALQNGITFDAYQKDEYQQSWVKSAEVSTDFLEYIRQELKPYSQIEWQSIEHVQFKVNQLIRPMLETIRNILRNIALLKEKSSKLLIKLCPIVLFESSCICYGCSRTPKRFLDFWIFPDDLHIYSDKCDKCQCSRTKHIDVTYELKYELTQYEGKPSLEEMKSDLNQIRRAMTQFAPFYGYAVDGLKQNDPLLSALKRIINEENQICLEKGLVCLNSNLQNILVAIKKEYGESRSTSTWINAPVDLSSIYGLIATTSEIDDIKAQLHVITQGQKKYLKQHEKEVSGTLRYTLK